MCLQESVPLVIYGWKKSFTESLWNQGAITRPENLLSFLILTEFPEYSNYTSFTKCSPQRKNGFIQTHYLKEASGQVFLQNISH